MGLRSSIQHFFGAAPQPATGANDDRSIEAVRYAMSLASSPTALAVPGRALDKLEKTPGKDGEATLLKLYVETEKYLVNNEPARNFSEEDIRGRLITRFKLDRSPSGMGVLVMDPAAQELKLALLMVGEIVTRLERTLAPAQIQESIKAAVAGTPFAGAKVTTNGLELGTEQAWVYHLPPDKLHAATNGLAKVFTVMYERLEELVGEPEAQKEFAEAYAGLKKIYAPLIDNVPSVATLMPEGVLEEEKLGYLSRDTLEERVREKTKQLELEKAGVERKVEDRTRDLVREQAKMQASIESLPLGYLMVDMQGEVIVQNATVGRIIGTKQSKWGLSDLERDMGGTIDLKASCAKSHKTKKPLEFTEVNLGSKILSLTLTPVHSGKTPIGTVILLEDITEAKVAERSKDEFFSIASHELRTPLTAIKGNASMILDYYGDKIKDPTMREMVEDVHTSSVRLIEIVNDFLDTSRLEQGKIQFKFQPFALDKVIEQVAYEMGPVLKQKGLKLRVNEASLNLGELPMIFADSDRTKQVIYNLVGNAAKFTEKGGITISARKEGKFLHVLVTDTGRGIPLEGQRLLFRKFQQAGNSLLTRDTTRGTGLGLYISKLLVEGMGGRIGLEDSEPGKGTTFYFQLPLATPGKRSANEAGQAATVAAVTAASAKAAPVAAKAAKNTKRIMIFEDDPYVQRLYRRLFAFEQWAVELVGDGNDAQTKVLAYKPDLIMLDIMMPKSDGLEVLGELRKSAATKRIPVVILTNIGESDVIDKAKALGISGYLIKADFTPEQMLEEVKRYL